MLRPIWFEEDREDRKDKNKKYRMIAVSLKEKVYNEISAHAEKEHISRAELVRRLWDYYKEGKEIV